MAVNFVSKVMPDVYHLILGIFQDAAPKPLLSCDVVECFQLKHPDRWDKLQKKYEGKNNFSAATFIADKTKDLKTMGHLDVEIVTDGFDKKAWPWSKTMGKWTLKPGVHVLAHPSPAKPILSRMRADVATKVKERAKALGMSDSEVIAQIVTGYFAIGI